jgi:transcription antitermination factor NusG
VPIEIQNDIHCEAWYALHTRHQHEKMVQDVLTGKGFHVFLPLHSEVRAWKDRRKKISLPLFPCYVFIKGGLERRHQIITTPGIHGVVSYGGQPAAISPSEIEGIARMVASGVNLQPHPFLKSGDWVRIKTGTLEGIQGIFVRSKNVSRLVLTVEMLGKAVAMEVNASQVEPLKVVRTKQVEMDHGMDTETSHNSSISLSA